MDTIHRTESPGTFSQRRGLLGLRALRGAERVDILDTLLAGAYSKFKNWPKDRFQPYTVACGRDADFANYLRLKVIGIL
jgi:hypothetical protein